MKIRIFDKIFRKEKKFTKRTIVLFNRFSFTYFVKKKHWSAKYKNTKFEGGYTIRRGARILSKKRNGIIIGNDTSIGENCGIMNTLKENVVILKGEGTTIGNDCFFDGSGGLIIGKAAMFAKEVFITTGNHEYQDINIPPRLQGHFEKPVSIGDDCWIGRRVIILPGVNIGKHCVIGAGSVVTKDVPDYSVAAGNPARVLKRYNFETKQWEKVSKKS